MTSSYSEQRTSALRTLGAPVDISAQNYTETQVDPTEEQNKAIDENTQKVESMFDSLIQQYNQRERGQGTIPSQILGLIGKVDKAKQDWDQFKDWQENVNALREGLTRASGGNFHTRPEGIRWVDEVALQQQNAENISNKFGVDAEALAASMGDVGLREQALRSNRLKVEQSRTLNEVSKWEPVFWAKATQGLLVDVTHITGPIIDPKTGKETRNIKSYVNAVGPEERAYIANKIMALYLYQNKDVVTNRDGSIKRKYFLSLLEKEQTREKKYLTEYGKELSGVYKELRAEDLELKLADYPGYAVDYVNVYAGAFGGSKKLAKQEMAQNLSNSLSTGKISEPTMNAVLDHPFEAADGTTQTIRKYWKNESRIIRKGLANYQKKVVDDEQAITENEWNFEAQQIVSNLPDSVTIDQKNNAISEWMVKVGVNDPTKVPDVLKNLRYVGIEDDISLAQQYDEILSNGGMLTEQDLAALEDTKLRDTYREVVRKRGGVADDRKSFIKKATDEHLTNTLGEAGRGTLEWFFTNQNLKNIYNAEYEEVLEKTGSHAQAITAAQREVMKAMAAAKAGNLNLGEQVGVERDSNLQTLVGKTQSSIAKDINLLDSSEPWEGEEPHLRKAALFLSGKSTVRPVFYDQILKGGWTKMSPIQLMRKRLIATGLLKEGEFTIPEEEVLKPSDAQLLLNKPSASRTYRVTKQNQDFVKLLDVIKSKPAIANGGYDAIRDKNGDYAELEKPLSEHTVGEVLELIQSGYTDFGMYELTTDAILDILESTPVELEAVFNQELQDLSILARLRQKSQYNQRYLTVSDRYRRLVNINQEDELEFLRIVGDIPPYLELNTLLPAVATEMVQQTLQ